jgi:hypothetical protein
MGQELNCRMRYQRRMLEGRAFFEGDHILFRGMERLKIAVKDLEAVSAKGGVLHLDFGGERASLELGDAAEKWANKILHPPSRADKLGIKQGLTFRLAGDFDGEFLEELRELRSVTGKAKADLVFLLAPGREALAQIPKLAATLKPAGALWVIYPKGVKVIRELEVLEAGRAAGIKDTKVASFSSTHTALRFVIPLSAR